MVVSSLENDQDGNESSQTLLDDSQQYTAMGTETLPDFKELAFEQEGSPALVLKELAESCEGLSGRTLSALPQDSLCLYMTQNPCLIQEALKALARGIEECFQVLKKIM